MDQLSRLGKRELICLLLFTCNYVVSVSVVFCLLLMLSFHYDLSVNKIQRILFGEVSFSSVCLG